jgi:hypothetical protein
MAAVFRIHALWNKRVPTPRLNEWLAAVQERHPPPLVAGRRLKLRYMTQDAGEYPPADLRAVHLEAERAAGILPPLSRQSPAPRFRPAGRPDPDDAAQDRQEPLRRTLTRNRRRASNRARACAAHRQMIAI